MQAHLFKEEESCSPGLPPPPTQPGLPPADDASHPRRYSILASALTLAGLVAFAPAAHAQNHHTLPLILPAGAAPTGFIRILNRSDQAGSVRILAIDDTGQRFGPVTLSMDANETVNFSSGQLEQGNESKGLSGGIGDGTGNWHLDLDTPLDIEPLAYVRSADGSLASVHDAVSARSMRHHVLTFNPGSNLDKRSLLRLVNPSGIDTDVVITGLDDAGAAAAGEVRLTLPADEARTLTAQALEAGGDGFEGRFGNGAGKWQVFVTAGWPIQVMSLLSSPGNLVNLSAGPTDNTIRGGPGRDVLAGGNGDDVFIPGDNDDGGDALGGDFVKGSAGDDMIVYTGSGPTLYHHIDYADLGLGITATIDGVDNRGSIDKGSAGTDTLVNVATPLDAGWTALGGGARDYRDALQRHLPPDARRAMDAGHRRSRQRHVQHPFRIGSDRLQGFARRRQRRSRSGPGAERRPLRHRHHQWQRLGGSRVRFLGRHRWQRQRRNVHGPPGQRPNRRRGRFRPAGLPVVHGLR